VLPEQTCAVFSGWGNRFPKGVYGLLHIQDRKDVDNGNVDLVE